MANRQIFQLTNEATPLTTYFFPAQISDGSVEAVKVTIANLKVALALVQGDVGLANVDNTSDANKPISTATQTALDLKVTGPASATDNAIARFDLATGKLIQNSLSFIDDTGKITVPTTVTAAGTTGAQTINKPSGTVNFLAAATTLVVTNSLVTVNSLIFCTIRTDDVSALLKNVVAAAGSFTITLNAAATAETSVGFIVFN